MRKLLFAAILLSQTASGAGGNSVDFKSLIAKADSAAKGVQPQRIFALEDAKMLAEAVMADVKDNRALEVVQLLSSQPYDSPCWQITAKTIISNPYGGVAPTHEGRKTLESIFKATIIPGDRWLRYSAPRGWKDPYLLRAYLASWLSKNVILTSQLVEEKLLREDPAAWLAKHGVDQKDGNSASASEKEEATPPAETAPAAPLQNPAPAPPLQAAPSAVTQKFSVPAKASSDAAALPSQKGELAHAFWLIVGALVLSIAAWLVWRKSRKV